MRSICLLIPLSLIAALPAPAQQNDSLHIGPFHHAEFSVRRTGDTSFVLPHAFIIAGSERISIDSVSLDSADYSLDARFGLLTVRPDAFRRVIPDTLLHPLRMTYRSLPFSFKPGYELHTVRPDTLGGKPVSLARPSRSFSFDDLFGSNLQKNGSIVRGFSVGSNRDLSLTSGFRMQMSGNLTRDLELIAALTDENSPIQPEGTTQTLQEVDKVFVELRAPKARATLGDFTFGLSGSEFAPLSRKLQGATGSASYGDGTGEIIAAGASTRGKFTTNAFPGSDGVQGPYLLADPNNDHSIIVIAGTERVYVNGERMTRGETNDYTIDYGNAELTFTTRRLISRSSRITVDFEYSDRRFNRTFLAGRSVTRLKGFDFTASAIRESDNESSPVGATLNQDDLDTLRLAGDDQQKASRSGVQFVGAGRGQYLLAGAFHDPRSGRDIPVYSFKPVDTSRAVYAITFSNVGEGNGFYRKISTGHFEFDSVGRGSYEPVRFLPMPQSHSLLDFAAAARPADRVTITAEYALSSFDPNKFSPIGDDQHNGPALNVGFRLDSQRVRLGSLDAGSLDLLLKERYVDRRFISLDRTNEVEFSRKWNVQDSLRGDEELHEGLLGYRPVSPLLLSTGFGRIRRGDVSSDRANFSGNFDGAGAPFAGYDIEYIRTTNGERQGRWTRQKGSTRYDLGLFVPRLTLSNEILSNSSSDSLIGGSFRTNEISPGIFFGKENAAAVDASVGWSWDDSLSSGSFSRASQAFFQRYGARLAGWRSLATSLDVTIAQKNFRGVFRRNADVQTLLLRSQTRYTPVENGIESDWFYEVATERAPKSERIFQKVPPGTGNYIYLGDVNGNHVVDAGDFQLSRFDGDFIALTLPTGELTPVIDVKASTRIRFYPKKIFSGPLARSLGLLSGESYFRVEEKSTETDLKQIYLLRFSRFLRDETTLLGSNIFTQDLYLLENDPQLNFRFRYSQRRGLAQFATLGERTYSREQSVRLRWQFVRELANQIDYIVKKDALSSTEFSNRVRDVSSNTLQLDWAYRPEQQIEVGFRIGVSEASDFDTTSVSTNDQSLRIIYAFAGKGQMRGELTREEVTFDHAPAIVPFELTDGKFAGKSWLWKASFDYEITSSLQLSAGYDGRSEGGRAPVHTARAEVRALF